MTEKHKENMENVEGATQREAETTESAETAATGSARENIDALDAEALREYAKVMIDALTKENEQLIKEQAELKRLIEKGDRYLDQLAAMKNDFENYRRRTNAQAETSKEEGKLSVLSKLLPVLDTFDRAKEFSDEKTMSALGLIVKQFDKVLDECGVEVIEVLGKPFDPGTANAVHSVETEKEEEKNVVLEVYANGYRYGDRVLRYAQVCVGV